MVTSACHRRQTCVVILTISYYVIAFIFFISIRAYCFESWLWNHIQISQLRSSIANPGKTRSKSNVSSVSSNRLWKKLSLSNQRKCSLDVKNLTGTYHNHNYDIQCATSLVMNQVWSDVFAGWGQKVFHNLKSRLAMYIVIVNSKLFGWSWTSTFDRTGELLGELVFVDSALMIGLNLKHVSVTSKTE